MMQIAVMENLRANAIQPISAKTMLAITRIGS